MGVAKAPRPPRRSYFVHGTPLANCGDELCRSCEIKPAICRSPAGHALCARCAGLHSQSSGELAREIVESRERTEADRELVRSITLPDDAPSSLNLHRKGRPKRPEIAFKCGHSNAPENVYTNRRGWTSCKQCARERRMAS